MSRKNYNRKTYNKPYKKELKILASDFCLLDRPEVREVIATCQDYETGRQKIMKVYEMAYMN